MVNLPSAKVMRPLRGSLSGPPACSASKTSQVPSIDDSSGLSGPGVVADCFEQADAAMTAAKSRKNRMGAPDVMRKQKGPAGNPRRPAYLSGHHWLKINSFVLISA